MWIDIRARMGKLEEYLKDLGIELIKSGFKEEVGFSLDEMLQASLKRNLNVSACTFVEDLEGS